jgi:DNA-binding HxlR family transcriptional regulator
VGFRARAGVLTLLYLASGVDRERLLEMLAEANLGQSDLDDGRDDEIGAIDIDDLDPEPADEAELDVDPDLLARSKVKMKITPAGREAIFVGRVLGRWLASAPEGPLALGDPEAGVTLAALVLGWSSTVSHAMARGPIGLSELSRVVDSLGPEIVEERAKALVDAGLAEARPGPGGEILYTVTEWAGEATAPLAAAARMEHRHPLPDTVPADALDVEAAFLLTLPLLELPEHLADQLNGSCRLVVEVEGGSASHLAGVTAHVASGQVTVAPVLDEDADAWATASAEDWLDTVIEPDAKRVRTGGDRLLASVLLDTLHRTLFGVPAR